MSCHSPVRACLTTVLMAALPLLAGAVHVPTVYAFDSSNEVEAMPTEFSLPPTSLNLG